MAKKYQAELEQTLIRWQARLEESQDVKNMFEKFYGGEKLATSLREQAKKHCMELRKELMKDSWKNLL